MRLTKNIKKYFLICTLFIIIIITYNFRFEIILDKGDRLITIANFNNLEMINNSQWLHIL